MRYDFDRVIDRTSTDSMKWTRYGGDVIPMWVADMDFPAPEPVIEALRRRLDHGILGYSVPSLELKALIRERLQRLYRWEIDEEAILFVPGLVSALNIAFQAYVGRGEGVLIQPPVYFHFVKDPVAHGRILHDAPLVQKGNTYEIDFESFEKRITAQTRLFVLCNPHNPVARVYTTRELERIAQICLRHGLIICSDEIHCDLLYPGYHHVPIATFSPEVQDQTVTLMAASKTFNLAGLGCGFAVIPNPTLRRRWEAFSYGLIPRVNIMGHVATEAALREGQPWLDALLSYLQGNRDFLCHYVEKELPGIRMTRMEATYLAWLDCREAGIPGNPFEFFLKDARVALSDGREFGRGGENFVRLNFACPRKTLEEALHRMRDALKIL